MYYHCIDFFTLGSEQHRSSSLPALCGLVSSHRFTDGHDHVFSVKELKSTNIVVHHSHLSRPLMLSLALSTLSLLTCLLLVIYLPFDLCGQVHMVARSHATHIYHCRRCSSSWIAHFVVPSTIVIDHGRQFESKLWQALMSFLGSKRAHTTAYHPQSNGLIERFHRQLKAALKAQLNPFFGWMHALPLVLLGIRTAIKEDTSSTTA